MTEAQGDLFASPPPRRVVDAHLPDPPAQRHSPTSVAAGEEIRPVATRLRARVLQALYVGGPLTDERIALTAGLNPSTERPRRIECLEAGWITNAGEGRTASGRRAVEWAITAAGEEALAEARGLGRG